MIPSERTKKVADDIVAPATRVFGATAYRWIEPGKIPRRDWLYGNLIARKYVTATVGSGGTLKTSKSVTEALAMATGRSLLGIKPQRPLRVWFLNLEDPLEEMSRRIQAAALHFDLTIADLGGRLFVDSGRDRPLIIGRPSARGVEIDIGVVNSLIAEIQSQRIDVVIVDPFVSSHRVPENDNGSIDGIVKEFGRVADRGNCAVELIHHTRKSGSDGEATTENARGGKSFTDACRSVRVINPMTPDEGKRAGVDNHRLYFRVLNDKANMVPPAERSDWLRLESTGLGNGTDLQEEDRIGVATFWKWPDHTEGICDADLTDVIDAIRAGRWRENSQAKDWVGHAVANALNLNLTKNPDMAKAKALIKKWTADGHLLVVDGQDDKRTVRKYVVVAADV